MQQVPLDKLMEAGNKVRQFGTVVDGRILPANPFEPVATTISADVPVMVGYTRTERTVYEIDSPNYGQLDEAGLLENVKRALGDEAEKVIASYRQKYPKATAYELSNQHHWRRGRHEFDPFGGTAGGIRQSADLPLRLGVGDAGDGACVAPHTMRFHSSSITLR